MKKPYITLEEVIAARRKKEEEALNFLQRQMDVSMAVVQSYNMFRNRV